MTSNKPYKKPFLDNKGTLGGSVTASKTSISPVETEQADDFPDKEILEKQIAYNRKRSFRLSGLKRKDLAFADVIEDRLLNGNISEKQAVYADKMIGNFRKCAANTLYRKHDSNGAMELISAHTCDHRLCFICNWQRQKQLRKKYLAFFKENRQVVLVKSKKGKKKTRAYTEACFNKMCQKEDFHDNYEYLEHVEYDLMHLTLTMPHYKGSGFRGYWCYFEQIMELFNKMRKKDKWNHWVYGGEYGVETTNGKNGLNTHIHSLLMVRKDKQNRNHLHKYILEQWNALTVNAYNPREGFDEYSTKKILKSNRLIKVDDVQKLHPKGATIIGLETIFSLDDNGKKARSNEFGSEEMLKAVMETISYHFEPQCFDKKKGEYDVELLLDIMPEIEGKPLYRKFGCLHGEKSLNIKATKEEQMEEDLAMSGRDCIVNPETLLPAEVGQYSFFMCPPSKFYHDKEHGYRLVLGKHVQTKGIPVDDTLSALRHMMAISIQEDILRSRNKKNIERTKMETFRTAPS